MDDFFPSQPCFHTKNALAPLAVARRLSAALYKTNVCPVIVCVGSDRVAGDSLGPLTGSLLLREHAACPLYGCMKNTVTAREIIPLKEFIAKTHPRAPVIAVDAAVGNREETGLIKVCSSPLYPGSGAKKQLGSIGDASLLGIVAGREEGFPALERVRYSDVYAMACVLKEAILLVLEQRDRLYAS